jgi:hypothetical protein
MLITRLFHIFTIPCFTPNGTVFVAGDNPHLVEILGNLSHSLAVPLQCV